MKLYQLILLGVIGVICVISAWAFIAYVVASIAKSVWGG